MARNLEKDALAAIQRKEQLMEAGFRLFSSNGIEAVSMQAVAEEAKVGVATLYNYYETKANLLVAISARVWGSVWEEALKERGAEWFNERNAFELAGFYADKIIYLYQNKPEILRFSSEFKTFICRKDIPREAVDEHLNAANPFEKLFFEKCEEAKNDGSIRTDIPYDKLFTTVTITMLGMAERYAQGIVWATTDENDYTDELEYLKEMILNWIKG